MRKNLREARQSQNMTHKQVAEHLNINERYYKAIEYGERLGGIELWDKLEDLFNTHQRVLRELPENRPGKEGNR